MRQYKWTTTESDYDYAKGQRVIPNFKMNKANYNRIDRYCRKKTYRIHCGCEHDCCGHLSSMHTYFEYSQANKSVTIFQTIYYNY